MSKKIIIISFIIFFSFMLTGCETEKNEIDVDNMSYSKNNISEREQENINNDIETSELPDSNKMVVTYFDNKLNEVNTYSEKGLKDKAIDGFVTTMDFIFDGGKINGITFNELSDSAKEKIKNIVIKMDEKIDTKYPNYKDNIKSESKSLLNNISSKLDVLKDKAKSKTIDTIGEEKYNDISDNLKSQISEDKKIFSIIGEKVVEGGSKVANKANDIEKKAVSKFKSWYKGLND